MESAAAVGILQTLKALHSTLGLQGTLYRDKGGQGGRVEAEVPLSFSFISFSNSCYQLLSGDVVSWKVLFLVIFFSLQLYDVG